MIWECFRFIPSDAGILKRYKEAAGVSLLESMTKLKDKDFEEILPESGKGGRRED